MQESNLYLYQLKIGNLNFIILDFLDDIPSIVENLLQNFY